MAKDPFNDLPQLADEPDPAAGINAENDRLSDSEDITAGTPPRTILKKLTQMAVPIAAIGIGIWLFASDETPQKRAARPDNFEVDAAAQANDTHALIADLRRDADTKSPPKVPVMPGANGATTGPATTQSQTNATSDYAGADNGQPPLPGGAIAGSGGGGPNGVNGSGQRSAEEIALNESREQDIRASAIEVPKVKLLRNAKAGPEGGSLIDPMQGVREGRSGSSSALSGVREIQEQMMNALTPKEAPKSKGNNQDFLANNKAATGGDPNITRQMNPRGGTIVNEGHVIRTVLLTDVSSDLPGRVLARVTSDVYDNSQRYVVIPKGSQIIGTYNSQVIVGQERLLMAMNRLIFPNGSWISLSGAEVTDMIGKSGLKADVNNHFLKMFGSSLILGASSMMMSKADATINTVPGIGTSGGSGTTGTVFATSLNDVLKTLLERNKSIQPTLSLSAGQEFIFLVAQDMEMVPYQQ